MFPANDPRVNDSEEKEDFCEETQSVTETQLVENVRRHVTSGKLKY